MSASSVRKQRIVLVSVLDWGLGHAARTSAVVRRLVRRGDHVILAGSGKSLALLCADHPDLPWVGLPSFSPSLSAGSCQWFVIMMQVPAFLFSIVRERWLTSRLVRRHHVDLVLSDNRYGVRSSRCASFLMTHQLRPHISPGAPRWLESLLAHCLAFFLRRFTGVLVPDSALGFASGDLSSPPVPGVRARCVGWLSRLADVDAVAPSSGVDWLGIVSGPEPQRGILLRRLAESFRSRPGVRVIVCGGLVPTDVSCLSPDVVFLPSPSSGRLKGLIQNAKHIVCRSGYSTLMDLLVLGRKATLVPTPGQAEQEYLADRFVSVFGFQKVSQEDLGNDSPR